MKSAIGAVLQPVKKSNSPKARHIANPLNNGQINGYVHDRL